MFCFVGFLCVAGGLFFCFLGNFLVGFERLFLGGLGGFHLFCFGVLLVSSFLLFFGFWGWGGCLVFYVLETLGDT